MAFASDANTVERMESLLTCSICMETLTKPRTLACFHSFCQHCLDQYVEIQRKGKRSRTKQTFNCPQCRTPFELRQGESVEQLPSAHFINNMIDIFEAQQQTPKLPCGSCEADVSAMCRCIECERYLCRNCLSTHSKWPDFKQHVVMNLEELAKPENQAKVEGKPRCTKPGHGNKPHEYFCNTCQELACMTCGILVHSKDGHDYQPIDVVAKEHRQSLQTISASLETKSNEGRTALQDIEKAIVNLRANSKRAKDAIMQQEKEIVEQFTKKLKQSTAVLLSQVENYDEVNERLLKQHGDMKAYVKKVNGSLEFAKSIVEKGNIEEILLLEKEIEANTGAIDREKPEMMLPVHRGCFQYLPNFTKSILDPVDLNSLGKVVQSLQSLLERSIILDGDSSLAQPLSHWMEDKYFGWQLCYRASRDGWRGEDFHRKCDDVGPTVTLVKCGINVFGGYTDQSWKPEAGFFGFKRSEVSFIFSLRNTNKEPKLPPFKCQIYERQIEGAIVCKADCGAIFGGICFGNRDLFICGDANKSQASYSNLGQAYQLPPGFQQGTVQTKALLAGSEYFQPTEVEVFCR
ncbi:E3 ubiquitin-protein ligase TRIM33-like [Dendronephthya gigantea]|uniref:E3 ubiquitin-protein ligase TRIM33-like n=1 Tax=Dendronephthya gigantea TaxID=151771 RepID=UPI00106A5F8D|nr:E3 ubiquitin-protein ligase TRIM33-like [Dendronephthya gigantea]